jgi:hypothetical protein
VATVDRTDGADHVLDVRDEAAVAAAFRPSLPPGKSACMSFMKA